MTMTALLALAIAGLFCLQSWLSIWSRRADRMRHAAIAAFVIGLPLLAGAAIEALGWNKPLWAMHELGGEYRVLGAKMIEGVGIYVYLDLGDGEPRGVALPWDTRTAENLQGLFDDPANQGQAMLQYEWSWERRAPQFHPLPQPPVLPPKAEPPAAPHLEL